MRNIFVNVLTNYRANLEESQLFYVCAIFFKSKSKFFLTPIHPLINNIIDRIIDDQNDR